MMVLELLVKAVEHTRIFVVSNIILSLSAVAAWPFLDTAGLWALVVAISVGYVVAILTVVKYLDHFNFPVSIRWGQVLRICLMTAAAVAIGIGVSLLGAHSLLVILAAYLVFAVLLLKWMPFTAEEKGLFRQMFAQKLGKGVSQSC